MSYGRVGFRWGYMDVFDFYSSVGIGTYDDGRWRDQSILPFWYDPLLFGYAGFVRAFVVQRESGAPIDECLCAGGDALRHRTLRGDG